MGDAEGDAASNLLNIPIRSEFLPLTHPKEALQHQQGRQAQQDQQQQKEERSETSQTQAEENYDGVANYWDWTSDAVLGEEEKVEDEIADLFSLSRIESNLISDSVKKNTTASVVSLPSHEEESSSYWEWSTNSKEGDRMSVDESASKNNEVEEVYGQLCENKDYWAWDSDSILPPCEEEEDSTKMLPASSNEINNSIVVNHSIRRQRKQHYRGRRHSLLDDDLPDPTTDPEYHSDHYWHWSESKFESYRNKRKEQQLEQQEQRVHSIAMSAYF